MFLSPDSSHVMTLSLSLPLSVRHTELTLTSHFLRVVEWSGVEWSEVELLVTAVCWWRLESIPGAGREGMF